jgi:sugar-specific transcriptional regulator TrmB
VPDQPGSRLLDAIWRELERRFDRVDDQIDQLEEDLNRRVDHLEIYHAEERARAGERLRDRALRLERWQKVSIAIGALGTLCGLAGLLVSVIR